MANAERLVTLKTPLTGELKVFTFSPTQRPEAIESIPNTVKLPNLALPRNSIFEVINPFEVRGSLAAASAPVVNDDDFDVEVVSFEEKAKVVSNLTTKSERILEGKGKVISFFREAADYKLRNLNDFRNLAEQAAVMARLNAAACAPGDGHGLQSTSSINSTVELSTSSNITSIFSKGGHKEGKHDHCGNCGGDLNDGKCSKCAA